MDPEIPQRRTHAPGTRDQQIDRRLEENVALERLRSALDAHDPTDREILILRKLFDVPAQEIAERVGLSASTVRGRVAAAMTALAVRLA